MGNTGAALYQPQHTAVPELLSKVYFYLKGNGNETASTLTHTLRVPPCSGAPGCACPAGLYSSDTKAAVTKAAHPAQRCLCPGVRSGIHCNYIGTRWHQSVSWVLLRLPTTLRFLDMPLCSLEQLRVISISILSHLCESSGFFQCSFFPGCLVKLHIGVLGSWWPANLSVIVILHAESPFTAVCSFQCHHPPVPSFPTPPARHYLSFSIHTSSSLSITAIYAQR